MKSYTDIEQSKKLAEILPIESADMCFNISQCSNMPPLMTPYSKFNEFFNIGKTPDFLIPCWSLAALLDVLPIDFVQYKHYFLEVSKMGDISKPYEVRYYRFREDWEGADYGRITHISYTADNPIDACVSMIEELHELKLL